MSRITKPKPRIVRTRTHDVTVRLTRSEVADSARLAVNKALTESEWGRWRITKAALLRLWWGS
jgi:hypothetical protein